MYPGEEEAKKLICEIGRKMYERQMVAANDGNIGIKIGNKEVMVTPTGVSKGDLKPEMLIKVDLDGNILEGAHKPTSEMYMHLNIYKHNPEVISTCHAHPVFCSAFAAAGIVPDLSTAPAPIMILGKMPVVPFACPGTMELANSVIPYAKDYNGVLLANHGPLTWGKTAMGAWFALEEAENYCRSCILLKYVMKEIRPISGEQLKVLEKNIFPLNDKCKMTAPDQTTNLSEGRLLSEIEGNAVHLSDACINKLADRIIQRISKSN